MVYRNDISSEKNDSPFMTKADLLKKLNRIDEQLEELLFSLKPYSNEILNAKPDQNSWSVLQICHHLALSEKVSLAYIQRKLAHSPKVKKVSLSTKFRQKLLTTYLITPMKYNAPDYVNTDALPQTSTLNEITRVWHAVRADIRAFIIRIPDEFLDKEIFKHPFAGMLCLAGMLSFFEGHTIRHQKQIHKTLTFVG